MKPAQFDIETADQRGRRETDLSKRLIMTESRIKLSTCLNLC